MNQEQTERCAMWNDDDMTQWKIDLEQFRIEYTMTDENFAAIQNEVLREIDHQKLHPYVWDSLIDADTWENETETLEQYELQTRFSENAETWENETDSFNDSQNMAITALQSAIFALKRADVELQNMGVDEEDIKSMVLWCEQAINNVEAIERIF